MDSKYNKVIENIKASEEKKSEIISLMQTKLEDSNYTELHRKRKIKFIATASTFASIICVCVVLVLFLTPAFGSNEPLLVTYRIGEKYIRNDGGTIIFSSIALEKKENSNDYYLIIEGVFDFELFSVNEKGIVLRCKQKEIQNEVAFDFDENMTRAMSDADINFGADQKIVRGNVKFVFNVTESAVSIIQQNNISNEVLTGSWDMELEIEGCETNLEKSIFVFYFNEIKFY